MRKLKLALILALTGLLIITGAFLPRITGEITDLIHSRKVLSAPMQSVQLEFSGSEWQSGDHILKKLAIERSMYSLPITPEETSMTEEEVFAAVEEAMDMYAASGIFSWFETSYRMAEPYLTYAVEDSGNMNIIWAVNLVHEDEPYRNLFLHLDDETGKILYLDYVTYDPDSSFFPEDQASALDTFTSLYFEQLGLDPGGQEAEIIQEKDVWCRRCAFQDTGYGDIVLEFYVKPTGFYISFPN
ncbi:MAG: hypothetical protein IJ375_01800 [Oscillospiraceae bacterium]|nr:hypothetical protein [Oscillospiraceae bacterium]